MEPMLRVLVMLAGLHSAGAAGADGGAGAGPVSDLSPVRVHPAPSHPPVGIVQGGKAVGSIAVMVKRSGALGQAVTNLAQFIGRATGAQVPIVEGRIVPPALVIGDCEAARRHGLDPAKLPIDGFSIKTAANHVFIAGRDEPVVGNQAVSQGTAWGVFEFIERFVGVRWYFPEELGQSVPSIPNLIIAPTWIEDAPAFRMRVIWPPMSNPWNGTGTQLGPLHTFLRSANSWPRQIVVHSPDWGRVEEYKKERPEVFQLRSDGTRDFFMLCYGHPRTLETYLENIGRHFAGQKPAHVGIVGDAITVSPNDAEIACYCEHCRKLWDPDGGQYGSASRIVAQFVATLARQVKERWPGKTVLYLPYLNYTLAPDGIEFPDNVEVQLCGMPGLAQYKEPLVRHSEQANIDRWYALTGRAIQNWHYSCWPEDRTSAVYLFPHTVRQFYQENREKTVGTFINGTTDHWPRQHLSLYCWLKVLWDPGFDVDAAIDEYCRRMYGPAAGPMRKLVGLQSEGWEGSRWPSGRLSPKAVHDSSFPRPQVLAMADLLEEARRLAGPDDTIRRRIDYYAGPFADFFRESRDYHEGTGLRPLLVQKVGENPRIDGKLDEPMWAKAEPVSFVRGWDRKQKEPSYPTTVRGVWTFTGVTVGFHMHEPTPDRLERKIVGRDDSMAWWDDNIELLFDVTGKNEGEFYHLIINPNGAVADAREKDFSWNASQTQARAHVGADFWSLEVFLPYDEFPGVERPASGRNPTWMGSFTRHRVADRGLKQRLEPRQGSEREYQRMNTTYANPSNNLTDFAPLRFVE